MIGDSERKITQKEHLTSSGGKLVEEDIMNIRDSCMKILTLIIMKGLIESTIFMSLTRLLLFSWTIEGTRHGIDLQ
jgi:hypothetical protein